MTKESAGSQLAIVDVDWSPDGTQIAAALGITPNELYCYGCGYGRQSQVIVWDVRTAERLHRFTDHVYEVQSVAFSPDGSLLVYASLDGTVTLWDMSQ